MRSLTAAALVAALAAGAAAQDKSEPKYESKDGKYAIAFPGKPVTTVQKSNDRELHSAIVEKGAGGYAVLHADLPPVGKDIKPKDILDGGQKGLIDSFKAKVTSSKDFEFGAKKFAGREILAEKDGFTLRLQLILADNRLYQIFIVGGKDMVSNADADKFFASFEITK